MYVPRIRDGSPRHRINCACIPSSDRIKPHHHRMAPYSCTVYLYVNVLDAKTTMKTWQVIRDENIPRVHIIIYTDNNNIILLSRMGYTHGRESYRDIIIYYKLSSVENFIHLSHFLSYNNNNNIYTSIAMNFFEKKKPKNFTDGWTNLRL